jgi:nucleoside-diphosphate-sugar epimerase
MENLADKQDLIVVTGGGGFIGGHLIAKLRDMGFGKLRSVDVKPFDEWFQRFEDVDNKQLDLKDLAACHEACEGASYIFNLACDMGGIGFIENHKALCMLSVLINTHMLMAAREHGVKRFLYSSSACVYAHDKQTDSENPGLKEADAYPAMPEDGYGWEKLFSERMCRHFTEDFGLQTRVVRYHNVYGPWGSWDGGREKAPAAMCRKIVQAWRNNDHHIEIWGDGEQTRSFMYIDDCIDGTIRLMESDVTEPLNLGSDQMVTINELVSMVEEIGGITCERTYNLDAPKGVRGRNSENTLIKEKLGWAPSIRLEDGMVPTYEWIKGEIVAGRKSLIGG